MIERNFPAEQESRFPRRGDGMPDDSPLKIKEINAALQEALLRRLPEPDVLASPVEDLFLVRREEINSSERCFARPLASLIVQGEKHSIIGGREYVLRENQRLVSGVDMPSMSYAVAPSPERPFLSLFFYLNRQTLSELLMEMTPENLPPAGDEKGVSVVDAETDFMEALLRLVELLDKPGQIAIRAPLVMRELHYLLLVGSQGGILRGLYARGAKNTQIVKAIELMRRNIAAPLRMDALARQVCMSVSSLHRYFKSVTGLSPLQYHKQLRLYEAQRLMLVENERAAVAAVSVGYESATQFSRDYKRMFGEPPRRDVSGRRRAV